MMDGYSTHQRLLLKAALMTSGPILELGTGHYSTPLLHEIAEASNRSLLSVDSDAGWIERFRWMETDRHRFQCVSHWDEFIPNGRYGMAFIDHAPAERREIEIRRLLSSVDIFVLHDVEASGYGYERILPLLEHVETEKPVGLPWTTICRSPGQ